MADPLARLRAACAAQGIPVAWDDTVSDTDCATLLHRSPHTLKTWRLGNCGLSLDFVRVGNRARYTLGAIAKFLSENRSEVE
jgi:hypothetical protein